MTGTQYCRAVRRLALCWALAASAAAAEPSAKVLFGSVTLPAALPPQVIGGYARGCVAGAVALPAHGPFHQAMRPSRNRFWGHPRLVTYLQDLSKKVHERVGWPGILVGDMAQPRGGPMLTGHASHQGGLDADIWLMPSPARRYSTQEREEVSAVSVLAPDRMEVAPTKWNGEHHALVKAASEDPRVARVFVNPAIKRALCEAAEGDRSWLRTVRAWYGHHDHIHVRLKCPAGSATCTNQADPPPGDGCGAELDWWFTEEPYKKPAKPRPELVLSDLPPACRVVYEAD